MNIIFNVVAFFLILLVYGLSLSIIQTFLAILCGLIDLRPTRFIGFVTVGLSAFISSIFAIGVTGFGLYYYAYSLSLITVILWCVIQLMGIARDAVGHQPDRTELAHSYISRAEPGTQRSKFVGQFWGTLLGAGSGVIVLIILA